jgi:DNA repair photolyase
MSEQDLLFRKTLLYKSEVEYADYGLNHVEGCSHGCTYPCYAMMLKKRCGRIGGYQDWIKPRIVSNALELLDKEIPRLKHKIDYVFMCFSTDPFMYKNEEIEKLSLQILARLNQNDVKVVLISKGIYPAKLADHDLYRNNEYGSTIVSLAESFRRHYEPFAAPIQERIEALKKLHLAGCRTWVSMEPYPTPNIKEQNIDAILDEISFVDKIVFGKWNYSKHANSYREYTDFYESEAEKVISFCERNGIDYHIKNGTILSRTKPKNDSTQLALVS